jgi:hypothetical protein
MTHDNTERPLEMVETCKESLQIEPVGDMLEGCTCKPLYTEPPHREWQGLTDGEIYDCFQQKSRDKAKQRREIFHAIETKLKDKNRGEQMTAME